MKQAEQDAVERRCLGVPGAADLGRLILNLPTLEALAAGGRRLVVLTEGAGVALLRLAPAAQEALVRSSSGMETRSAVGDALRWGWGGKGKVCWSQRCYNIWNMNGLELLKGTKCRGHFVPLSIG